MFFPFLIGILSGFFFSTVHTVGFSLLVPLPSFDAVDNTGGFQKLFFSGVNIDTDTGNPFSFISSFSSIEFGLSSNCVFNLNEM